MKEKKYSFVLTVLLVVFAIGWTVSAALGHPAQAVISFDEGFHGGTALYVTEVLRSLLSGHGAGGLGYLRGEFNNGIIFYPPLWNVVAGFFGWLFGPSTMLFRLVTTSFSVATAWLIYSFACRQLNSRAAFIAVLVFLTAPLVYLYSHLMMLEVPLAFGTALVLLTFYYYLTAEKVNWSTILLVALAFAVGVQGKIIGIAIVVAVLGLYGVALLLFWRHDRQCKRFFAWPTLLFAVVGALSWYGYIWAVKHFLHADMLGFFLGQSKGITQTHLGPLGGFVSTLWTHKTFYWRDFGHYPWLGVIWFGSLVGYLLWKRTPLAAFLFCYALGTWIIFSGVAPQEVQYLLPIFVPLAIVTGALISELVDLLPKLAFRQLGLIAAAVILVILQASAVKLSEAQGWRYNVTDQEAVASYIAAHAHPGDRVIAWSDSTIYAVQLAAYNKHIQIYNGGDGTCTNAMQTATDWAVIEPDGNGSGNQKDDLALVNTSGWQLAKQYHTSGGTTYLYHILQADHLPTIINAVDLAVDHVSKTSDPSVADHQVAALTQSVDEPNIWGCYRMLPLDAQAVTFRLKATNVPTGLPATEPIARVEISRVGGSAVGQNLTAKDLSGQGYIDVTVPINAVKIDSSYELRVWNYQPMTLIVDTITIH